MVVRFIPTQEPSVSSLSGRGKLAEVIEFRAKLQPARDRQSDRLPVAQAKERSQSGEVIQFGSEPRIAVARAELAEIEQAVAMDIPALEETASAAEADAVRLLARRARSSGELRRELTTLGHSANDIEAVLLACESNLYLDDVGLARVITEGLRERKRASRSQIRMKLRERLLPDFAIEEALGELDESEEDDLLCQAAGDRARKMVGLDRQTAERRLLGFLARRGWSGERATRVAREALDNTVARGTVRFR